MKQVRLFFPFVSPMNIMIPEMPAGIFASLLAKDEELSSLGIQLGEAKKELHDMEIKAAYLVGREEELEIMSEKIDRVFRRR